jgi:hypothetical protein
MIGLRSIYFSSKDHSVLYYGDKNGTGLLNYVAELSMNSTVQILSLSVHVQVIKKYPDMDGS